MRNLLAEVASSAEISVRIEAVFKSIFGQDSPERIYFERNDEAYIVDTGNNDVRTEGMSYGMMIAVQLDKPDMFSKLWRWVCRYMTAPRGSENEGYFLWNASLDGIPYGDGPAPDGEEYFAAALLLAERRWGIKEYGDSARSLLHDMLHKGEKAGTGEPMFEPENKYIRYVPNMRITDPSYHLPHFLELFAEMGNLKDREFFETAAAAARAFLIKSADEKTGLTPEYADYDGKAYDLDGHWTFFSEAYRTAANIGLDWAWSGKDEGQRQIALKIQKFFAPYLGKSPENVPVFKINGQALTAADQNNQQFPPLLLHHPIGLWATLAEASLATFELDRELAISWLKEFWNLPLRTGQYRYYDNLLYLFALLALSGNYLKEW